jgi:hypothetical protein
MDTPQSLEGIKPLVQSRTVWANVIGLCALLASVLGYQWDSLDSEKIVDAILQIVAGVCFVASTFFRVLATKRVVP